jgi:hypothetical protein
MYNPGAHIVVLIDEKTKTGLTGKRSGYETLVTDAIVITVPAGFSQKEASRWIKTSINRYVAGNFLFIDCDTVITGKLECDFPPDLKIGAVLDCHVSLSKHHLRDNFQKEDIQAGFCSSIKTDFRYNGGLIYCNGSSAAIDFFEKWHSLWLESRSKGNSQDMPALNQANYELDNVITALGGEWNCQIGYNGLRYLHNAKIIHYFATSLVTFDPPYLPGTETVLLSIKDNGIIPEKISELLQNPLAAFNSNSRIIADENALDVINCSLFYKLLLIRKNHPDLFKNLNSASSTITKFFKKT